MLREKNKWSNGRGGEMQSELDRDTNLGALESNRGVVFDTSCYVLQKLERGAGSGWVTTLVHGGETMPFRSHFHPDKIDSRTRPQLVTLHVRCARLNERSNQFLRKRALLSRSTRNETRRDETRRDETRRDETRRGDARRRDADDGSSQISIPDRGGFPLVREFETLLSVIRSADLACKTCFRVTASAGSHRHWI
ncbi:hypothetical protein K0M31_018975 [Melipona bicolor]|uniref:Uncharacterized protein n=1 Tax=Melipona bicolor TaxID=60889 RepID=A0AA40KDW6_9HYME|nr:hypothetical protein K0M31_018975 [Melipona bicolor]